LLALKFILDAWAVEETLKTLKQLELANQGIAVIERLSEQSSKSALEVFDFLTEVKKVILELTALNIHDIVGYRTKLLLSGHKLLVELPDGLSHGRALGVTNLDVLQLIELHNGLSDKHQILAPLSEGIQSYK